MNVRSVVMAGLVASTMMAGGAFAQTGNKMIDEMIAQLRSQGYTQFQVGRTFFGRIRIDALSKTGAREVIMNRYTGEVLRDADMSAHRAEMLAEMAKNHEGVIGGMSGSGNMGGSGNGMGGGAGGGMGGGAGGGMGGGAGGSGGGMGGGAGGSGHGMGG
ncbi:MAG: hypothetical protein Q9M41_01040 [Paracoccaceae bacterium]|nr:hypothetical protein [Paracoccaceae bacterium]